MNYLEIAEAQLRRDEGCKPYAYQDSKGLWTIGVGILIDQHGGGLEEDEITFLLDKRIDRAVNAARLLVPIFDRLSEIRKAVLVNMAFQLGADGLSEFENFLAAVNAEQFEAAADHMLDSKWARNDSPNRAHRLAEQMRKGDTP